MQILKPDTLARWIKLLRVTQDLSQDALAAACGLTTRTIQRVEAGEPSTVTTRRALARGLGYDNINVFDDPEAAPKIEQFDAELDRISEKALEERFPDRVRIPAAKIRSGQQLGQLAEQSNAWSFHFDDDLNDEAKGVAATIIDYLRDYSDVDDSCSATEKLKVYADLNAMLRNLETAGAVAHSGMRSSNFVGANWVDKTPMPMKIAYFVVDAAGKEVEEIWAAKRVQFG